MKLRDFPEKTQAEQTRKQDLLRLLQQPTDKERRPCPGCDKECGCPKHSTQCCCECSYVCPDVPNFLSSDPEQYPIEPHVVPLVYSLSSLRLVPPCWSCEGHNTYYSNPVRMPQVWFYSAHTIYAELISHYLHDLSFQKKLVHSWQVIVCPHTEGGASIFQICPERNEPKEPFESQLGELQKDLHTIGSSLAEEIRQLAQNRLNAIQ